MKKIVIMGATSGIGLRVAQIFAEMGWVVGAVGRNVAALNALAGEEGSTQRSASEEISGEEGSTQRSASEEISSEGSGNLGCAGRIVVEQVDVTREDAPEGLMRLVEKMGGMDVYLHVAGIWCANDELSGDVELRVLQTNVDGFTRMVDAAFGWMRDHNGGAGRIAAITSVAGTEGIGVMASYSSSKAFQQFYLRALDQYAREKRLKIRFTDIRPGWVRTPLLLAGGHYPMLMNVEKVAQSVVQAVLRGRRVAVIDGRWNVLVGLCRLIPHWLWVRLPIKPY